MEADNSEILVIHEVLQRQTTDQDRQKYTQIVLPVNHRQEVIIIAHSTAIAGHLGTKPTQYKIMKNFCWPGMVNDACQSCECCQKTAKRTHSTTPMQITTTFTEPFHRVALDIVGPLPRTKRKHTYILTTLIWPLGIPMQNRYIQQCHKQWQNPYSGFSQDCPSTRNLTDHGTISYLRLCRKFINS